MSSGISTLKNAFDVFTRRELQFIQLQQKECFVFNNIRKKKIGGEAYRAPMWESGGNVSHTFSSAQTYSGDPSIQRFVVETDNLPEFYRTVTVTNKALRAMKGDALKSGVERQLRRATESVVEVVKEIERELFRSSNAAIGTVSAVGATTATMTNAADAKFIRPGAGLVACDAASPTGALLDSGAVAVVDSVNPLTGVVTFTAALSGTLASLDAGDYLFYAGSAANTGSAKGITGFEDFATGGTIHGVTTSDNPSMYQFQTATGQLSDIQKAITDADALAFEINGTTRDKVILNPRDFARLADTVSGQTQYSPGKGASIGYSYINVNGVNDMEAVRSPYCPQGKAYLLNWEGLELVHLPDNPVNLDDLDGKESNRVSDAASNEWRVEAYPDLVVLDPGAHVQLTLSGS